MNAIEFILALVGLIALLFIGIALAKELSDGFFDWLSNIKSTRRAVLSHQDRLEAAEERMDRLNQEIENLQASTKSTQPKKAKSK